MATKSYLKAVFGFEPIDDQPFLADTLFASEALALEHAKSGVSAYPGKIISVKVGNDYKVYQIISTGASGSIRVLGDSSDITNISQEIANLQSYVDGSINRLQTTINNNKVNIDASITSIKTDITNLRNTVTNNKTEIDSSISSIKTDITNLRTTVTNNKSEIDGSISSIKTELNNLKTTVSNNKTEVDGSISSIKTNVTNLSNTVISNKTNTDASISEIKEQLDSTQGNLDWIAIDI